MPVEHVCGSPREFAGVRWWHGRKGVATVLSEWKRARFEVFQLLQVCAKNALIQALRPRGQPRCWGEARLASESAASIAEGELALCHFSGKDRAQESQIALADEHRVLETGCRLADAAGRCAAEKVRYLPASTEKERRELHSRQVRRRQSRKFSDLAEEHRGPIGRLVAAL